LEQLTAEIQDNIIRKNYLSALSLSLIIPDICGKIAFPEMKINGRPDIGGRYAKWYDEYIYAYENPLSNYCMPELDSKIPANPLDGYAVYKLRCAFLHEGSLEIQKNIANNLHRNKEDYKQLEFLFTDKLTSIGSFGELGDNKERGITIRIGVEDFCKKICWTAENYYKKHATEEIFNEIISFDFL